MMDALQPLWNVLDDEKKRDISSCIMFTNTIKMKYNLSSKDMTQYFKRRIKRMDAEIINNYPQYYDIDLEEISNTINRTFKWCINRANSMIFPLISKLLVT